MNTNPSRFSFDGVGSVFFGEPFRFIQDSVDHGGYIDAVHTAMPLNSVVAMAPSWLRPTLLCCGIAIPKVFKGYHGSGCNPQDGGSGNRDRTGSGRSLDVQTKRTDVLSKILSIENAKPDKLTINDVHVEM